MRVVITGASGFVGRHLREHLSSEGDVVLPFGPPEPGFLDVLDRRAVFGAISSARPEGVYHLAGFSHVGSSFEKPLETIRVNVEGTLNVLDACREARVERVLLVGSSEEYGDSDVTGRALVEEDALRPLSPYGASKVAAEFLGLQAHLGSGLATIMTRSFNHTGPGQSADFVVPAIARRIARAEKEGGRMIQVGSLEAVREFNDVRDVVRAYRLLMLRGRVGGVYNVCSGIGRTVEEVVRRLIGLCACDIQLRQDPSLVRKVESGALVGDPSRLKSATGWEPHYTLDQTLLDVLEAARASALVD